MFVMAPHGAYPLSQVCTTRHLASARRLSSIRLRSSPPSSPSLLRSQLLGNTLCGQYWPGHPIHCLAASAVFYVPLWR